MSAFAPFIHVPMSTPHSSSCNVPECLEKAEVRGLCSKHYSAWHYDSRYSEYIEDSIIDGRSDHPLYSTWVSMRQRCQNPNHHAYSSYGGRGISVCSAWDHDFWAFYEDIGPQPSAEHTLDRVNNDGDYEPSNVRWATHNQQNRNQNRSLKVGVEGAIDIRRRYDAGGVTQKELAEEYGVHEQIIYGVLRGKYYADAGGPLADPKDPRSLTKDEVLEIRNRASQGDESHGQIADDYVVSRRAINRIVAGESYKDVGGPTAKKRKVTGDETAKEIRQRYATEDISLKSLAKQYLLDPSVLSKIVRGKTYKSAGGPIVESCR